MAWYMLTVSKCLTVILTGAASLALHVVAAVICHPWLHLLQHPVAWHPVPASVPLKQFDAIHGRRFKPAVFLLLS